MTNSALEQDCTSAIQSPLPPFRSSNYYMKDSFGQGIPYMETKTLIGYSVALQCLKQINIVISDNKSAQIKVFLIIFRTYCNNKAIGKQRSLLGPNS